MKARTAANVQSEFTLLGKVGIVKEVKSSNILRVGGCTLKGKLFYAGLIISFVLTGIAHYMHMNTTLQFVIACIAIIFVAGFLGKATESVAHYAGERVGGFLNATFGNAAELIIAIFLVKDGLYDIVKASLTGAIIGNLLLVLGLSIFAGGLKFKEQTFNVKLASHNSSLMILGVVALFIPAIFTGD